jgi:ankyrin repeat protein
LQYVTIPHFSQAIKGCINTDRHYREMGFLDPPNELSQAVIKYLNLQRDINALIQTSRQSYSLFNSYLYSSNIRNHNGSAMVWAAEHGQIQTAEKLILEGLDVQSMNCFGLRPLNCAAFSGQKEFVAFLLANGADPEQKGLFGRTPLHEAARSGHEEVVRFLLAEGVDLEPTDSDGRTPLHAAACHGHEAVTSILLENCVNLQLMHSKDLLGCTPLMYAAKGGYEAVVMQLIAKGAQLI